MCRERADLQERLKASKKAVVHPFFILFHPISMLSEPFSAVFGSQESALQALRAVSADDEDVPGEISSVGGVQFVCQALLDFKHFQGIQEQLGRGL